ncbi:MAG: GIY-YIG nuclease family protein [Candidatus Portnoybacteria bacterium]|nr:GIY-YIG nuclease family protein [Candidatus Portnoybacteria bacterium]MDD4982834.1 GIY-YIG nuclease family protein [Candidatus Portnoybacteria bacterium]
MFYVYFLKSLSNSGQNYIGYTSDLRERIHRHNNTEVLSTKPYVPWELIFYESFKSKRDAKRREGYFKTSKERKALKIMLRESLR